MTGQDVDVYPETPTEDQLPATFGDRLAVFQSQLVSAGIDAALISSEPNFRYLTGFHTDFWLSKTRPWFLVVPAYEAPVAVIPEIGRPVLSATAPWVRCVETWPSPRPNDEGITLLARVLTDLSVHRLGLEMGPASRLGMPIADFHQLLVSIPDVSLSDVATALASQRSVKDPDEIGSIRAACEIGVHALNQGFRASHPGTSERDIARIIAGRALGMGADAVPYSPVISGRPVYQTMIADARDKLLRSGDVVYADIGLRVSGYYCDLNRNWAVARCSRRATKTHAAVQHALDAALDAIRPGMECRGLYSIMCDALTDAGVEPAAGRMGHGIGLEFTEEPSIDSNDSTTLKQNMVLAIEPAGLLEHLAIVCEENVLVTESGCELLSDRGSRLLPVAGA